MSKCIKCGSYAFNLYKEGIDQGGLCDVHYWQGKAHRAEALAEQEPVGHLLMGPKQDFVTTSAAGELEINVWHPVYTSPPAQRTWVGLTGHEQKALMAMSAREAVFATEAKLKEKNT